jgi:hypothetical protein
MLMKTEIKLVMVSSTVEWIERSHLNMIWRIHAQLLEQETLVGSEKEKTRPHTVQPEICIGVSVGNDIVTRVIDKEASDV